MDDDAIELSHTAEANKQSVNPSPIESKKIEESIRCKVDHSYIDHYSCSHSNSHDNQSQSHSVGRLSGCVNRDLFPFKLMHILSTPSIANVISWQTHGRCFRVRNTDVFTKQVLPRYFKTNLMGSFRKQLSLWGFKRITKGADAGCYYHQSFLRGIPDILGEMKYKKIKGVGRALKPNPEGEPDFYQLQPLPKVMYSSGDGGDRHGSNYVKASSIDTKCQSPGQFLITPTLSSCSPSTSLPDKPISSYLPSSLSGFVTDDDISDNEVSAEECLSVYRQMRFPGPFTPPPELLSD